MDEFEWTKRASDAAQMIADGDLSYEAVASAVDISPPTLRKWRDHPDFIARVESIREDYREHVRRRGIAVKERRVEALNTRHRLMMQVIQERGADPRMADVPGGTTGLMAITGYRFPRREKDVPTPPDDAGTPEPEGLPIVEFDAALLKSLLDHEKQAAVELGQWAEKKELSGPGGAPVPIALVEVVAPPDVEDGE